VRFYEFEAKRLLARHGIAVPPGKTANSPSEAEAIAAELGTPVTLKAQVLFGNIEKAGGSKVATSPAEAKQQAEAILALTINGKKPRSVLVEKLIEGQKAYSLRATYDGIVKLPVLIASDVGGKDIDDITDSQPDRVKRRHFSTLYPQSGYRAKELAKDLGLGGATLTSVTRVLTSLADVLLRYDLTVADVTKLVQTADGKLIAVDVHMDLEIEGRNRQKAILAEFGIDPNDLRLPRTPTAFDDEGVKIDKEDPRGVAGPILEFDGNIGLVIGAGGGSLTTFDAVRKHGGKPANYAAIGGNPSVRKAQRLTKLVLSKPGVEKIAVISNVVSNTRADLVARGVIKGVIELGLDPAKVITIFRVPGAWEADAFKILEKYGVEYCDRSVSISEAAKRAVQKIGS
jgi:succinyl-CoA synthetase beta subunit/citryl-CoA synthetase large subunit